MFNMGDQERREGEEVARMLQGNLLNKVNLWLVPLLALIRYILLKVYEIQSERERQSNLVSEMMKMTVSSSQTVPMNTCDLVAMAEPNSGVSVITMTEQQDMEVCHYLFRYVDVDTIINSCKKDYDLI